jgi:transcriptional regulator NrdR family protein
MNCPMCKEKMGVLETRTSGMRTRRRYQCEKCGRRYTSLEDLYVDGIGADKVPPPPLYKKQAAAVKKEVKKEAEKPRALTDKEIHRLLHRPGFGGGY